MECREVRRLLDAFVSEQLSVESTAAIVAHLEECPACRAECDGLRRLRATTRCAFETAPDLLMRPEFAAALASRLQTAAATKPQAAAATTPQRGRTPGRYWLALAATIALAAGGVTLRMWSSSRLMEMLRAAVGDHQNCALTFNLSERPISLHEAASFDPVNEALAAVAPASATLPGGPVEVLERHSCIYDGRRFAHIVLRYKGEAVSVLVSNDPRPGFGVWLAGPPSDGTVANVQTINSMQVTAFHQSQHSAFVVSSLADADLRAVAGLMVEPISRALAGA